MAASIVPPVLIMSSTITAGRPSTSPMSFLGVHGRAGDPGLAHYGDGPPQQRGVVLGEFDRTEVGGRDGRPPHPPRRAGPLRQVQPQRIHPASRPLDRGPGPLTACWTTVRHDGPLRICKLPPPPAIGILAAGCAMCEGRPTCLRPTTCKDLRGDFPPPVLPGSGNGGRRPG